ncbi:MAG TPA: ABC transporter substrate-binding protein [Gemmatimonadaceae bacterium]|jgi:hypothetical protein
MSTQRTTRRAASLGAIAIGIAACTSARPGAPAAPAVASCVIGAARANAGDTLVLATMAPVIGKHVPEATNAAERLVFAQAYETLIDIDCDGRARPGLAASWTLDATRSRVTLALRSGAAFWSGKPVTAGEVLAAWQATASGSTASTRLAREMVGSTTIVDDHTLIVSLPDTAWPVLSDGALAIYEPQSGAGWPEGSGPYRIARNAADTLAGGLVLTPFASSSDPYLVTRRMKSGDPRDAIDAGSDVLVTDDPVAVSYGAARANLVAVPLPWTRTYALAVPSAPKISPTLLQPDSQSVALRASLAHDAVHAEARAAQPPYWWDGGGTCIANLDSLPARASADGRSNRVVYRRDDGIARGLAERLVALDPRTVAAGLAQDDFARALRDGGELAYVLDLPRGSLSLCNDVGELRSAAPWLLRGGADVRLVPLIDTRQTAIVNRHRVSAAVDWRGTLHFSDIGSRP